MSTTKVSAAMQVVTGWEYVSKATASASASLAFTNMVSGYDYLYVLENIKHATDATSHQAELGIAGPTYRTASYICTTFMIDNLGNSASFEGTADIRIVHNGFEDMGNLTDEALYRYSLELTNPAGSAERTSFHGFGTLYGGSPAMVPYWANGIYNGASEAHTSIKFASSSGNITSGEILQYRRIRS